MNKANEIIFSKDRYKNREEMFAAIAKQLTILMENDYVCKVYDDDTDIIVIQYEHDERKDSWGGMQLLWLTQEEIEAIELYRLNEEDNIK